jgi:hypothetical protein
MTALAIIAAALILDRSICKLARVLQVEIRAIKERRS